MASAVLESPAAKVVAATSSTENRLRLSCISWDQYCQIGEALRDRPVRMTYDRGELEIMTTSARHESHKSLIARLLEALTEELNIEIRSLGNMTHQREDLERGFEADECWYIQQEAVVRGKVEIDLSIDPPPDLALEIEISRSVLDRIGIYQAMGVPELWRFEGSRLRIHVLKQGGYEEVEKSQAFPTVPMTLFTEAIAQFGKVGETQIVKAFRKRVREILSRHGS